MLCGEEGARIGRELETLGQAHEAIVARTLAIDERVAAALVCDGTRRVMMLGAGLDARPYRLSLPRPLRWTEVDLPAVIEWKTERLRDKRPSDIEHELRAVDLASEEARRALFDSIVEPTLVVIEGVLVYLPLDAVTSLLQALSRRPVRVIADLGARAYTRSGQRSARAAGSRGAMFRTQMKDPRGLFERSGFDVLADVSLAEWDAARTDARWRRPFFFALFTRDLSRVIDARSASYRSAVSAPAR